MSSPRKLMVYDPDLTYISYSQLGMFNACAYKHQLNYKRGIKPVMGSEAMDLGSALHQALEAYLLGEDPAAAVNQWADRVSEDWRMFVGLTFEGDDGENVLSISIADMAGAQVAAVVDRALALLPYIVAEMGEKWEVVKDVDGLPLIEYPLVVVIEDDLRFYGVVDAVLREKETGLVWVVDFKTKEYIQQDPEDDFETQTQLYAFGLSKIGIEVNGSLIYQMSTKIPKIPKVNKTGGISRSEIATTWEIYERTVIDNGYDPLDYQAMKEKLEKKRFFHQIRTYRSMSTLERAWSEFIEGVSYMLDSQDIFKTRTHRGEGTAPRSMNNFSCPRCSHRLFCMAEYEGGTAEHLLGHLFVKEEVR